MDQVFFEWLPSEITLDILSRLPARTATCCKLVCKSWFDLIMTHEFVKSHLSKSVPCLAIFQGPPNGSLFHLELGLKPCKLIEFVNDLSDEYCWDVINLDHPFHGPLLGSANGLLLHRPKFDSHLHLCNPVTREHISIVDPLPTRHPLLFSKYGFGVSKISGHYKVVRFSCKTLCQVYTIGTRLWRSIAFDSLSVTRDSRGLFLNGNLHWLEWNGSSWGVCCLDLETELFSFFSAPPVDFPCQLGRLSVLGDCLCVCLSSKNEYAPSYEINIWLMKEYGDEKSWTTKFVLTIKTGYFLSYSPYFLRVIKVFEDSSILLEWGENGGTLLYDTKTNTTKEVDMLYSRIDSVCITTPSFVPLKTFAKENVVSF